MTIISDCRVAHLIFQLQIRKELVGRPSHWRCRQQHAHLARGRAVPFNEERVSGEKYAGRIVRPLLYVQALATGRVTRRV